MPFAAVGAGVGAIGGIIGGGKQADAAKKAAQLQADATNRATDLQASEFNRVQQNERPFLEAGYGALDQIQSRLPELTEGFDPAKAGLPSAFSFDPSLVENDPAFKFAVEEGTKALQRTAAARGNLLGGATQKAVGSFVAGTADQFYNADMDAAARVYQQNYSNAFSTFNSNQNNIFNRLAAIAQGGQGGIQQVNSAGQTFANNAGANMIGAGNAGAASIIAGANAANGGLASATSSFSSLLSNPSFQDAMKKYFGGGRGSTPSSSSYDD